MTRPAGAILLLLALSATAAPAQTVVDRCSTDTEPGGRNLADALARGGRITFACPPGTSIRMTRSHSLPGGVSIDGGNRVTLNGHGQALTLFTVLNGDFSAENLAISNVRLRTGGAFPARATVLLASSGNVTLRDVTVTACDTAILIRGAAEIADSDFLGNSGTALSLQGKSEVRDTRFIGNRTGLSFSHGTVRRALFSQNTGSGLRVSYAAGPVEVVATQFLSNVGQGAVRLSQRSGNNGSQPITFRRSLFEGNVNTNGGGAVTIFDSVATAPAVVQPALMMLPPSRFVFAYSRFLRNRGSAAGAILANLNDTEGMTVKGGIFVSNASDGFGGAISWVAKPVLVSHSLFRDNAARKGAALFADFQNPGVRWTVANSLFAENKAEPGGGVIEVGPIELLNVTVARNQGIGFVGDVHGSPPDRPVIANAIMSENSEGNCRGIAASGFRGRNLQFGHGDCEGVVEGDPLLDALFVPELGSPALTMGDVAVCREAPVSRKDMIFQSRATSDRCALGAFERPPIHRVPEDLEGRGGG